MTTKLNSPGHGYEEAQRECRECLRRLGMDYVDLLLIHSPFGGRIAETWGAMLKLKKVW